MTRSRRIAIVVPCYNEAARLRLDLFRSALDETPGLEFVYVDDGSTDTTSRALATFRNDLPTRVHLLELGRNSGKSEAVRRGALYAFDHGFELIGYWDADLATPLRHVALFAELFEKPEIMLVIGSRVQLLGRRVRRNPVRHYVGRGFATLAALTLGIPVYDTQCGAKLFRATPTMKGVFSRPFSLNWAFDVELLMRLIEEDSRGAAIEVSSQCVEYPVEEWVDAPGSKLRAQHIPSILVEIAGMIWMARKRTVSR
jgi:glycosyltransferase involved in cell wall biosynthesis